MPLEYLKSLNKLQTVNKTRNESNKDKCKLFYTEVYDISPRQQKTITSNNHKESRKTSLLNGHLSKFPNLPGEKADENKRKSHIPKINQLHDSSDFSHKFHTLSKKENKNNPTANSEISIKKRDYIVKQIPLKNDVEFSIDRNHCPMVVRIHKGHLNKSKKQKPETSHSQPLTHSHSCPPRIENKHKVAQESKNFPYKDRQQRSKSKLLSHGYTLAELLNLSPRKPITVTPENDLDKFINDKKSNLKRITKNKNKIKSSSTKEKTDSLIEDDNKYAKKKCLSQMRKIKPHKVSLKEKSDEQYIKLARMKEEEDNYYDCYSHSSQNSQFNNKKYSLFKKPREIILGTKDDVLKTLHISENCEDVINEVKVTSNKRNKVYGLHEPRNQLEVETSHGRHLDCCCHICKNCKKGDKRKKKINISVSSDIFETVERVNNVLGLCEPQDSFTLEKVSTKKGFAPENVVTLDASQSQFYKISEFLKNKTLTFNSRDTNSNELELGLSPSALSKSLSIDDKDSVKNIRIMEDIHSITNGKMRKVRSEEMYHEKYIDMNNLNHISNNTSSESLNDPLRCNSSLSNMINSCDLFSTNLEYENLEHNNSSPHYKCLRCNKSACEIMDFDPYCSDCNLKIKLSQISNESTNPNPDTKAKKGMVLSTKTLTTIPESDMSISKQRIDVAIQTDHYNRENDANQCNKINSINYPDNLNNTTLPFENIFEQRTHMESQSKVVPKLSNCNVKEISIKNSNENLKNDTKLPGGDGDVVIQEYKSESCFPTKNDLFSINRESRKCFSLTDEIGWPTSESGEPNIHGYWGTNGTLQKKSFTSNENVPLEHQYKVSVPSFVSPIFPEKEYYRITCNKYNPELSAKCSNETVNSKTALERPLDFSLENKQKISENNLQSRSDRESPNICTKSGNSYICFEQRIAFSEKKTNINRLTNSPLENSAEESNEVSLSNRIKSTPDNTNMLPSDLFSATNIESFLLSFDKNNSMSKENCKTSTSHTLTNDATKNRDLNCISTHQLLKCLNSPQAITDYHDKVCDGTRIIVNGDKNNQEREIFDDKTVRNEVTSTNCLQKDKSLREGKSKNSFYKPFDNPNLDFDVNFTRVEDSEEDRGRKINKEHELISCCYPSTSKMIENYGMNKTVRQIPSELVQMHSFSYIFFNISVPSKENDLSNEESYEVHDSPQTGLILMPESAYDTKENGLNDILLGNTLKTEINNKLILRNDNDTHEFNVFELQTPSKLSKADISKGSELRITNSEQENSANKPLLYKSITPDTQISKPNNDSALSENINHPISLETAVHSSLIEQQFDININQRETNKKALKKRTFINPINKKTKNKKTREERKHFLKLNNLFMCGYMAHVSLFRFMGSLQTKMCSELRK